MKKMYSGVIVATIAIAVSIITTSATNQPSDFEMVRPISATEWTLVDEMNQGITWDCFEGGTKCIGALKPRSFVNSNGNYDDDDVISWISHSHYEEIP